MGGEGECVRVCVWSVCVSGVCVCGVAGSVCVCGEGVCACVWSVCGVCVVGIDCTGSSLCPWLQHYTDGGR